MRRQYKLFYFPFFVLLIGIYPALSLLGNNISEVHPGVVIRPLLFELALIFVVWAGFKLLLHSWQRSAVLSTLVLILFYVYGHVYNSLAGVQVEGILVGRHRYLIAFSGLLFLCALLLVRHYKKGMGNLIVILNIIALTMLVFPVLQISEYGIRYWLSGRNISSTHTSVSPVSADNFASMNAPANTYQPDIYYIILDMYTRDDVLKETYHYDNQPFLDELEKKGFYIGRCSRSNYAQTQLSVASSLNMNYLDNLAQLPLDSTDRTPLDRLIENNAVRRSLEGLGYKTVSLSAYAPLKIESADVSYSTDPKDLTGDISIPMISQFEAMFIKNSAIMILFEFPEINQVQILRDINYPFQDHIRQQRYILHTLKNDIPKISGPKFVFVHIQIPHPPFVFGPDGEVVPDPPPFPSNPAKPVSMERTARLVSDQVQYIDKQILDIVSVIQSQPGVQPVIILQGDHGIIEKNRMPILNAYNIPPKVRVKLYPSISPVNSFRLILNELFDLHLPLVDDRSYYSTYAAPYQYTHQPETRPGCIVK